MAIDIILLIIAGYGFFVGFSRGIIKTILYILAIVFGIIVAVKFAPSATDFLITIFDYQSPMMYLAGFILCLALTVLLIRLLAKGLEGLLRSANINIINQFLGGLLTAALFTLLYSVLIWFADKSHLLTAETKASSRSYAYLAEYPGAVRKYFERIQPSLEDFWDQSVEFIDEMEDATLERTDSDPNIYDLDEEESNNE